MKTFLHVVTLDGQATFINVAFIQTVALAGSRIKIIMLEGSTVSGDLSDEAVKSLTEFLHEHGTRT